MKVATVIAALSLGSMISSGASAQLMDMTQMITNKGVQKELKVDPSQASELSEAAREIKAAMLAAVKELPQEPQGKVPQTFFEKLDDPRYAKRRQKIDEIWNKRDASALAAVARILKPEQVKRFRQICLQSSGTRMLFDEMVADELKLSHGQRKKLVAIGDEQSARLRETIKLNSGKPGAVGNKLKDLRTEMEGRLWDVLTAEQKQTKDAILGPPFAYVPDPFPAPKTK